MRSRILSWAMNHQTTFSVFIYRFFTGLLLHLRPDISKATAHENIQHLYNLLEKLFVSFVETGVFISSWHRPQEYLYF
jgi:hypothetical protein